MTAPIGLREGINSTPGDSFCLMNRRKWPGIVATSRETGTRSASAAIRRTSGSGCRPGSTPPAPRKSIAGSRRRNPRPISGFRVNSITDLKQIPLHAAGNINPTDLDAVSDVKMINTPTEVDHYQLRRIIDVYVSPASEDLGSLASKVDRVIGNTKLPENVRVTMRGSVEGMRQSFKSFGIGLILSIVLVYLILMAQFSSFIDPLIILLAIPPGITGVILFLLATHTTINVMSLMGVIMMTGIVVSNSILIVEFTRSLRKQGMPIEEAVATACRVRLRPVLMTSLATILGMIPMALALEAGSEQYAPLARAIIGGLTMSVIVTVFIVPAAYLWIHRREEAQIPAAQG